MKTYTYVFQFLGGLGLFIYGMNILNQGLEKAAGNSLKNQFEKLKGTLSTLIFGTVSTAIIQSSTTIITMVLGFVNAGVLNLYQATGIILGSNLGTTITSQIISLNFMNIAPLILGIGCAIAMFGGKDKLKTLGEVLLGFGFIFIGITLTSSSGEFLMASKYGAAILMVLSISPWLSILLSAIVTAFLRRSSAFIAILIALAYSGSITFEIAFPLVLGCNLGNCITAIIESKGTSKAAKKSALIHLIFNAAGVIIAMILISFIPVNTLGFGSNLPRKIANLHTLFNFANVVIQAPFIYLLVKLVNFIVPGEDIQDNTFSLKFVDTRLLDTPAIAIPQTIKECTRMCSFALLNIKISLKCFENFDFKLKDEIHNNEEIVNHLENEITKYLVSLSKVSLTEKESEIVTSLFHVVNDIERIGDHAENLMELAEEKADSSVYFSVEALTELRFIYENAISAVTFAMDALDKNSGDSARKVIEFEKKIDILEKQLRCDHFDRLNKKICSPEAGAIFLDAISNIERIGDHSNNIAHIVLDIK